MSALDFAHICRCTLIFPFTFYLSFPARYDRANSIDHNLAPRSFALFFHLANRRLYLRNKKSYLFLLFFLNATLRSSSVSLPQTSHVSLAHPLSVALFFSFLLVLRQADALFKLPFICLQQNDTQVVLFLVSLV